MWYFAWLPGLPLAALFAILNAMCFELRKDARLSATCLVHPRPA